MRILGIETSCDETAASIVDDGRYVLSNVVRSQHSLHETYGGVVPELASRAHVECIQQVIQAAIDEAGRAAFPDAPVAQASRSCLQSLDAIAVGNRPGLIGSLIVGVSAAKALAWSLDLPLIGIDHVQAHLAAVALTPLPPREGAGGGSGLQFPRCRT